jgi:hypothetical protein
MSESSSSSPGPASTTSRDIGAFRCKTCETSFSSNEELECHSQQAHKGIVSRGGRRKAAKATIKRKAAKVKAAKSKSTKRKATSRSTSSKKRRK